MISLFNAPAAEESQSSNRYTCKSDYVTHTDPRCSFPISVREAESAQPAVPPCPRSPFPPALLCWCWHGHKSAGSATWFCWQQTIPSQTSRLAFGQTGWLLQLAAEPHEDQGDAGEAVGADSRGGQRPPLGEAAQPLLTKTNLKSMTLQLTWQQITKCWLCLGSAVLLTPQYELIHSFVLFFFPVTAGHPDWLPGRSDKHQKKTAGSSLAPEWLLCKMTMRSHVLC